MTTDKEHVYVVVGVRRQLLDPRLGDIVRTLLALNAKTSDMQTYKVTFHVNGNSVGAELSQSWGPGRLLKE